jgi:hypothetical protein
VIESKHLVDANPFAITEKTPYSNNKANAMRCSSFISSYDFGKALYEVFKYIGVPVEDLNFNQPKGMLYPTENPFA